MSLSRTGDRWIPALTAPAPVRLFCLPYAGGGASVFRPWATALPRGLQLAPIQLPGREERLAERPFTRANALVCELAQAIQRFIDVPYALFGHSMGALLSLELARELTRHGHRAPLRLFVSAHRAPDLPPEGPPLHTLDDEAFIAELRNLSGTPEEILEHRELMALALPLLRADFELCATYRYEADGPLDVPITVMSGAADAEVPSGSLDGWRRASSASVTFREFAGDHFYVRHSSAAILAAIRDDLGL